jgi:hypothetical protein
MSTPAAINAVANESRGWAEISCSSKRRCTLDTSVRAGTNSGRWRLTWAM